MATTENSVEWRPVVGYEGIYSVSEDGQVRHDAGFAAPPIYRLPRGYLFTRFPGSAKPEYLHRLVMAAFVGPCPARLQVNHKDGNKANNHVSNLEYCTQRENNRHAREVLGYPFVLKGRPGEANNTTKLTNEQVREIRHRYANGETNMAALAREFGLVRSGIRYMIRRVTWKHI